MSLKSNIKQSYKKITFRLFLYVNIIKNNDLIKSFKNFLYSS